MNRTNFRHRTLDQTKPLPIIRDITEIVKKEDTLLIQIPNGHSDRQSEKESDNKEIIEQEIKKIIDLFDKKKVIIIPKSEKLNSEKVQPTINENNYSSIANYSQTNFDRPKHYLLFSERNRLEAPMKEYEASVYDVNFLKHFNYFTVDELEKIIITLENDVNTGEMIPLERAQYLLRPMFPNKEQYFEKVYQYWVTRREEFKKPLLRKYWKDQKCSDKYIGTTFRKREREKMRTRRYKKNDIDELQKLKEIKLSMEQYLLNILKCIKDREIAKKQMALLDHLVFKGEISAAKPNTAGIEKEWNIFINNYQKVKLNFNNLNSTKIPREINYSKDKENEERKVKIGPSMINNINPTTIPTTHKEKKMHLHQIKFNNNEIREEARKTEKKSIRHPKNKKSMGQDINSKKGDINYVAKKEEIERIKYFIRKDRYNRYVIHRYINHKNIYTPFDETYTKEIVKNSSFFSQSSTNGNSESNFLNYFDKYSRERYPKLYTDSDDDDNLENFQKDFADLSSNLKQFLKKKKDSSSRYILSN